MGRRNPKEERPCPAGPAGRASALRRTTGRDATPTVERQRRWHGQSARQTLFCLLLFHIPSGNIDVRLCRSYSQKQSMTVVCSSDFPIASLSVRLIDKLIE